MAFSFWLFPFGFFLLASYFYHMLFTDQMGRKLELSTPPKRIVSLVPSQSELLWDLGLREELVGITRYCIHPLEMMKTKTKVGGTKKVIFEKITALQPDLIIGNKEENEQADIERLSHDYPVWMSDIYSLPDALDMIVQLGCITGKEIEAYALKQGIEEIFEAYSIRESNVNRSLSCAYFIWRKPYMVAGHGTYINEMLKRCGFKNVFENGFDSRYPIITQKDILKAQPELVLLSSEPFPFKEKHVKEFTNLLPYSKVMVVDGEMFSWYGSRLLKVPAYIQQVCSSIYTELSL